MSESGHEALIVRHHDRRVSRTLSAVVEALTQEALSRPLHDITVTDLADRAGIGRSTFYEHFDSIEGLLLWLVDELIDVVHDSEGDFRLDQLLTFVAGMPEVTRTFLEIDSCAARCEDAIAEALASDDPVARRFAAAGTMALLRSFLDQTDEFDQLSIEELVTSSCRLVDAVK